MSSLFFSEGETGLQPVKPGHLPDPLDGLGRAMVTAPVSAVLDVAESARFLSSGLIRGTADDEATQGFLDYTKTIDDWQESIKPDPDTTGSIANFVGGLERSLAVFGVGSLITGSPAGGLGVLSVTEGEKVAREVLEKGGDVGAAQAAGAVRAASTAASGALPAVGSNVMQTVGLAVGGGAGTYLIDNQAISDILGRSGAHKLAKEYEPTLDGAVASSLVPLAVGGAFHANRAITKAKASAVENKVMRYADAYQKYGKEYGVDPAVLAAIARVESGGNIGAVSKKQAKGLMQFIDSTAKQYNVDVNDPVDSIRGAAAYLKDLLRDFNGSYADALTAYNAGPGRLRMAKREGGKPLARESLEYATKVYDAYKTFKGLLPATAEDVDAAIHLSKVKNAPKPPPVKADADLIEVASLRESFIKSVHEYVTGKIDEVPRGKVAQMVDEEAIRPIMEASASIARSALSQADAEAAPKPAIIEQPIEQPAPIKPAGKGKEPAQKPETEAVAKAGYGTPEADLLKAISRKAPDRVIPDLDAVVAEGADLPIMSVENLVRSIEQESELSKLDSEVAKSLATCFLNMGTG